MSVEKRLTEGLAVVKRWLDRAFPPTKALYCYACGHPLTDANVVIIGGRPFCDGYCPPSTWRRSTDGKITKAVVLALLIAASSSAVTPPRMPVVTPVPRPRTPIVVPMRPVPVHPATAIRRPR